MKEREQERTHCNTDTVTVHSTLYTVQCILRPHRGQQHLQPLWFETQLPLEVDWWIAWGRPASRGDSLVTIAKRTAAARRVRGSLAAMGAAVRRASAGAERIGRAEGANAEEEWRKAAQAAKVRT